MKAKLKFDLDDSDDKMAHLRCVKSLDMALALFEISFNMRKTVENRLDDVWDANINLAISMVFESIEEELDERGININELII